MKNKAFSGASLYAFAVLLPLSSCNADYDFEKLDTGMNVLQSIDIPVSMKDSVSVSEYFDLQLGNVSVDLEDIVLNIPSGITEQQYLDSVWTVNSQNVIHLDRSGEQFPECISELKTIVCDTAVYRISFKIDDTGILKGLYLKEGFSITFPDWITLKGCLEPAAEMTQDGHGIVFINAIPLWAGNQYDLDVLIDRMDFPEGAVKNGGLHVEGQLNLNGEVLVGKSQIAFPTQQASTARIKISGALSQYVLKNAEMKLKTGVIASSSFSEKIFASWTDCSFSDVSIACSVDNSTSLSFRLSAKLFPEGFETPEDIVLQSKSSADAEVKAVRADRLPFSRVDSVRFNLSVENRSENYVVINKSDAVYLGIKYVHSDNGLVLN